MMPPPDPQSPRRRRRPSAPPPPRQRGHKHVPEPQGQARKRILSGLHDTIGHCETLFGEHGDDCACETCCLASNLVGSLRIFHMLLEIS